MQEASFPRQPSITILWVLLTAIATHWALSSRHLDSILDGRSLDVSLNSTALWSVTRDSGDRYLDSQYQAYGQAWKYFLPLVTETVLFGFASILVSLTICMTSRRCNTYGGRSCASMVAPTMALIMYLLSLLHWAISLGCFVASMNPVPTTEPVPNPNRFYGLNVTLAALFAINAFFSDSIVLWRMCVVWNYARPVVIFGVLSSLTTLVMTIASGIVDTSSHAFSGIILNDKDPEDLSPYGSTSIGLAAAFLSLLSNTCATALVALKAWSHRRQLSEHARLCARPTLVERILILFIDSGVMYTGLWILYCASLFHSITSHAIFGSDLKDAWPVVTTSDHLDAAMAQLTSIYPLVLFLFVALDKVRHSRELRPSNDNEWPRGRRPVNVITFSFDTALARSTTNVHTSASPIAGYNLDVTTREEVTGVERKQGTMDG